MRDPARINRMIELLRSIWHAAPDQRLGQLVVNLMGTDENNDDIWIVEDDVAERKLRAAMSGGFPAARVTK